jgi:predicted outer membrane repeat protein
MKRLPVESRPSLIATGGHSRRQDERISRRGVTAELDLLPTILLSAGCLFDAEGNGYLLLSQKLYRSAWSREISFRAKSSQKGGAIYATTFLDLMTIKVKLLSVELPAVTGSASAIAAAA